VTTLEKIESILMDIDVGGMALYPADAKAKAEAIATALAAASGSTAATMDGDISICPRCMGCGIYNSKDCSICDGTGRLGKDGLAFRSGPVAATMAAVREDEFVQRSCGHKTCCECEKCKRCFACCVTSSNPCEPDYDFHTIDIARKYTHFSLIGDEPAGLCWAGDHYPDEPLKVTNDINAVTCGFCQEHWNTLNDLKKALGAGAASPDTEKEK